VFTNVHNPIAPVAKNLLMSVMAMVRQLPNNRAALLLAKGTSPEECGGRVLSIIVGRI